MNLQKILKWKYKMRSILKVNPFCLRKNSALLFKQVHLFLLKVLSIISLNLKYKQGRENKFTVFFVNNKRIPIRMRINWQNLPIKEKSYLRLTIRQHENSHILIYLKVNYYLKIHNSLYMHQNILNIVLTIIVIY